MSILHLENIPVDILPLIFENLTDRRDLHTCAQLSKAFHRAATPILYRRLDSRIVTTQNEYAILHPSRTLLARPEYAKYVRHISATGFLGFNMPALMHDYQEALRLCINLESFSWSDDSADGSRNDENLLASLDILLALPLKELTVHTYNGISDDVWNRAREMSGLRKVAIWCMEGQPRILQGWSEKLGPTLTHLELGRCAGVPATILVSVLSHLTRLKALRLKGAASSAILEVVSILPELEVLDTEYLSGLSRYADIPIAALRELTVRTSSVDVEGPHQLWNWIQTLLPRGRASLEAFTLHSFSMQGDATIPRRFLLDLAAGQAQTLKEFNVDTAQLTLDDIECLCSIFPALESLSCATSFQHPLDVAAAIAHARNLRELRTHTGWVPVHSFGGPRMSRAAPFEVEHVREMMLRKDSRLRVVGIGRVLYKGRWVLSKKSADDKSELEFEVVRDVVRM